MKYEIQNGVDAADSRMILDRFKSFADGVVCSRKTPFHHAVVVKKDNQLQLFFVNPRRMDRDLKISGAMSRMDIDEPDNLASVYTRVMMLSFAWCHEPRRVCVLGLGGGRIPMVIRRFMPETEVDCVELDPEIVSIAEKYFAFQTDGKMSVAVQDAREYFNSLPDNITYDIIMIDCFTGAGHHPGALSTVEFYNSLKSHLAEGGVVVSNLHRSDQYFKAKVATFVNVFPEAFLFSSSDADVVFGGVDPAFTDEPLSRHTEFLDARYGFPFTLSEFTPFVHTLSTADFGNECILTDFNIGDNV